MSEWKDIDVLVQPAKGQALGPQGSEGLSRRHFLYTSGFLGAGLALGACSPSKSSSGGAKEIRYWYWADSPPIGEFFSRRIKEFNDSQGKIRVVGELQPDAAGTAAKIVTTGAAGGKLPDLAYSRADVQQQFFDAGISQPVDEYFNDWSERDDIAELDDIQRLKPDQPRLWMPWGIVAEMQYYRADQYKELGLTPPDTIEQTIANARALTDGKKRFGFGIRGGDLWGFSWDFLTYLMNMGVTLVDAEGRTTLDSPEAVDAATKLISLYWDGIAQPSALEDKFAQMVSQFQMGTISHWQASTNHSPILTGAGGKYDDVTGVTMCPKGSDSPRKVTMSAAGNTVFKASKNREEAWEFITFLMSTDVQAEFSKVVAYSPVRKSVAADDFFRSNRFHRLTTDSAPYYATYPYWHKNWQDMQTRTGVLNFQRTLQRQMTVPELMTSLAKLMRDV